MIPLRSPQEARRPTAVALGSFDGLHRGHRRVIEAVTGWRPAPSRTPPGPVPVPTVLSFWPHPREVLYGDTRLRLDLPVEKLSLLDPLGIEQLVLVPFDRDLAALSPEAFIEQVLVGQLQARVVAVGENFRFGAGRSGDAAALVALGARHGLEVRVLPMLQDNGERFSSSRIRKALSMGDLQEATRLLQRPYRFSGRVVRGRGLGREIGWPTANLQVDGRKFLPLEGVYAAFAQLGGGPPLAAVMNLGPQPTVDPMAPSAVEVHLLDRQLELEGRELVVEPLALLRRQQRFSGLEELSAQIARDADRARELTGAACPQPSVGGGSGGGVGVGQAPDDEGADAPQQQNP
ncbi:bifunctional riboflavin kinase/FAD synthetase [Cyanobium sp. Morenito 9A2]|uniref:bifunctional riboflavin kinase/FAD synthetase n=1 Tax=Cyanobium sp. Morenito 9A2 TaxID=2823718 RepID=UPI0028F3F853|nr:bifunctional riboflavin kinase/FAD synthetase [Cyanobium sp. Morenito 9A2]MCP9849713.1 bifunctional riboflavin kinase/FAD synthetase [Cyanobium sp. Morenito 9A2]